MACKKCIMKASDSIHLLQKQCIKYGETLYNLVTLLFEVILLLMSVIRVKYSDNLCLLPISATRNDIFNMDSQFLCEFLFSA